jgi:dTDP-4-dehydrorhamnose reductase
VATALLLVGSDGQLGQAIGAQTTGRRYSLSTLARQDVDLRDRKAVGVAVSRWAKAGADRSERMVVINAAGYTAVDAAETDPAEAYALNAEAPRTLASACKQVGARLIQISTDYVFDGTATKPYEVEDTPRPISLYGKSKLAGEEAVLELLPQGAYVVRTAWLYGATGQNFAKTMVRLERQRDTVSVVADQRGSPTWSSELASGLLELADADPPAGIYHAINAGETTWHGFARAIFEELGADPARVVPITTEALGLPARRPPYSVLSSRSWAAAGLPTMQEWRRSVSEALRSGGGLRIAEDDATG